MSNVSAVGKEGCGLGKKMKVLRVRVGRVKMEAVKLALLSVCFLFILTELRYFIYVHYRVTCNREK